MHFSNLSIINTILLDFENANHVKVFGETLRISKIWFIDRKEIIQETENMRL